MAKTRPWKKILCLLICLMLICSWGLSAYAAVITATTVSLLVLIASVLTATGVVMTETGAWESLCQSVYDALGWASDVKLHIVGGLLYCERSIIDAIVQAASGVLADGNVSALPVNTYTPISTCLVNGTLCIYDSSGYAPNYSKSPLLKYYSGLAPSFTVPKVANIVTAVFSFAFGAMLSTTAQQSKGVFTYNSVATDFYFNSYYPTTFYNIPYVRQSGTNYQMGIMMGTVVDGVVSSFGVPWFTSLPTDFVPDVSTPAWETTGYVPSISADGTVGTLPLDWANPGSISVDGVDTPALPVSIPKDMTTTAAGEQTQAGAQAGTGSDVLNPDIPIDKPGDITIPKELEGMTLPALITSRFPFCIPFDLADAIMGFEGLPRAAPKWDIKIGSPGTTGYFVYTVDFSQFDALARITRWGILIIFNIGLIIITRQHLIKG